jgi:hypothetical protein
MKYILPFLIVSLFSCCAQLNVFHTARTEGKGNVILTPTLEGYSFTDRNAGGGDLGSGTVPGVRLEASYGLTDYLDISASVSSSLALLTSLKYQLIGSNYSPFALSIMPGYEYQTSFNVDGETRSRLHLPIIASYYPTEDIGYFVAPKYAIEVSEGSDSYSYPGFSAGISIERRVKYVLGGGLFVPWNALTGTEGIIYQFGISARIPIYKN